MTQRRVILEGGLPWGFRMHGGIDLKTPLKISRVNPGSKAAQRGIREGDIISSINGQSTKNLTNNEAHNLLKQSGSTLSLGLNEDTEGSPKRRQYRTIHQEIHQETVKRSSYSIKESIETTTSKTENGNDFGASARLSKDFLNGKDTKQNGREIRIVTNIPVSQKSTPSSSSTSTPSTLVPEGRNTSSDHLDHAIASRQSSYSNCSSIPDEGLVQEENHHHQDDDSQEMNNGEERLSKSKKRRQRRKNLINKSQNVSEVTKNESEVESVQDNGTNEKEEEEKTIEIQKETTAQNQKETCTNIEILKLKKIEHKYKVESPKEIKIECVKNGKMQMAKSKSLDDDEFLKIQELSETSESEDIRTPSNVIISEASSEENLLDNSDSHPQRLKRSALNSISLELNDSNEIETVSHISPAEEQALRTFLGGLDLVKSPEESAKQLYEKTIDSTDKKNRKEQKRRELEQYFLPIAENPRFLDAISEETSDISDKESPSLSKKTCHIKQCTPEQDLGQIPPPVPPRPRGHRIEQPSSVLVETKIMTPENIQDTVYRTQVFSPSEERAEVVYLNDSSESLTSSGDFEEDLSEEEEDNIELDLGGKSVDIDKPDQSSSNDLEDMHRANEENVISRNADSKNKASFKDLSVDSKESLVTSHRTHTSVSTKIEKSADDKVSFDCAVFSELTPPPTPDDVTKLLRETSTLPNKIIFDYTKIPNILTCREPEDSCGGLKNGNVKTHKQEVCSKLDITTQTESSTSESSKQENKIKNESPKANFANNNDVVKDIDIKHVSAIHVKRSTINGQIDNIEFRKVKVDEVCKNGNKEVKVESEASRSGQNTKNISEGKDQEKRCENDELANGKFTVIENDRLVDNKKIYVGSSSSNDIVNKMNIDSAKMLESRSGEHTIEKGMPEPTKNITQKVETIGLENTRLKKDLIEYKTEESINNISHIRNYVDYHIENRNQNTKETVQSGNKSNNMKNMDYSKNMKASEDVFHATSICNGITKDTLVNAESIDKCNISNNTKEMINYNESEGVKTTHDTQSSIFQTMMYSPLKETVSENFLRHVMMTSNSSNKTDSEKLNDFNNLLMLNNELKEKISRKELIGPTFRKSKSPNNVKELSPEKVPGQTFVQKRVREFTEEAFNNIEAAEEVILEHIPLYTKKETLPDTKNIVKETIRKFSSEEKDNEIEVTHESSILKRFLTNSNTEKNKIVLEDAHITGKSANKTNIPFVVDTASSNQDNTEILEDGKTTQDTDKETSSKVKQNRGLRERLIPIKDTKKTVNLESGSKENNVFSISNHFKTSCYEKNDSFTLGKLISVDDTKEGNSAKGSDTSRERLIPVSIQESPVQESSNNDMKQTNDQKVVNKEKIIPISIEPSNTKNVSVKKDPKANEQSQTVPKINGETIIPICIEKVDKNTNTNILRTTIENKGKPSSTVEQHHENKSEETVIPISIEKDNPNETNYNSAGKTETKKIEIMPTKDKINGETIIPITVESIEKTNTNRNKNTLRQSTEYSKKVPVTDKQPFETKAGEKVISISVEKRDANISKNSLERKIENKEKKTLLTKRKLNEDKIIPITIEKANNTDSTHFKKSTKTKERETITDNKSGETVIPIFVEKTDSSTTKTNLATKTDKEETVMISSGKKIISRSGETIIPISVETQSVNTQEIFQKETIIPVTVENTNSKQNTASEKIIPTVANLSKSNENHFETRCENIDKEKYNRSSQNIDLNSSDETNEHKETRIPIDTERREAGAQTYKKQDKSKDSEEKIIPVEIETEKTGKEVVHTSSNISKDTLKEINESLKHIVNTKTDKETEKEKAALSTSFKSTEKESNTLSQEENSENKKNIKTIYNNSGHIKPELSTNKSATKPNVPPLPPPRRSKNIMSRKTSETKTSYNDQENKTSIIKNPKDTIHSQDITSPDMHPQIPVSNDITYTNVLSPPRPASAGSDSSESEESSRCTAKYNPNSSIGDVTSITKEEENDGMKHTYEPLSLRSIVLNAFLTLPFGEEILKEIAEVSKNIDHFTNQIPFKGLTYLHSVKDNNISATKEDNLPGGWYTEKDVVRNQYSDERSKILELHEKFLTRRKYGEEGRDIRNTDDERVVITSIENMENDATSPNRLLHIIREEPNEFDYPNESIHFEDNTDQRLHAKNLNEWLILARNKSKSTSNLDCTNIPINNLRKTFTTGQAENEKFSNTRRRSLPQEIYAKQMIDIMEKEREIQRELEKLEEEKRKLRADMAPSKQKEFQVDDFFVSKKGDFAEMRENVDHKQRPMSMPVFPTEFFRQQMYDEYMDKFSEREERKQQKVIKISSSSDLGQENTHNVLKSKEIIHPIEIEQEFMDKVKQKLGKNYRNPDGQQNDDPKQSKTTDDIHSDPPVIVLDGDKVKGVETLPKHLQEFVDDLAAIHGESIWSPGQQRNTNQTSPGKSSQRTESQNSQGQGDEPISAIWTPKSANSSPTVERKEFRTVNFQSPVLSRKNRTKSETIRTPDSTSSEPPWFFPEGNSDSAINRPSIDRRLPTSQSSPGFGSFSTSPRLPKAQNPTITLLQKAREGQLPRGAHYIDQDSRTPNDRPPIKYPGEVLYHIKNEYTSESDSERPKRMADLAPRKFEGIGPTSRDGMPLVLRSEIKDKDQSKWYKRMYETIHKQKPHRDEFVTIRYKQKRAQYPYTSGYLSEPEPGAYDSDFTDYKYQTLDRRRMPQTREYISKSSTMPRNVPDKSYSSSDIIRNTQEKYQPGRIENYMPGRSSISEKEAKQWWDEVMEIFDGHLEQQSRVPPQKPRSFINQALKESGYESDSTLIFKRKEDTANLLSPKEQRQAYKVIQKGGDVPFQGLRKPAPERPKETDLVEFFPISPTLTKIRIHKSIIPSEETIIPQQEYFCYPATVHHNIPKTFASFKRATPSSVNVGKVPTPPPIPTPPPSPPKRKSSRNNSTLRLISTMKVKTEKSPFYKRHETCFTSGSNVDKTKVNYLRDKITCKLSPLPKKKGDSAKFTVVKKISASPELKSKITSTLTTSRDPKSSIRRVQSSTRVSSDKSKAPSPGGLYKSSSTGSITSKKSSTESLISRTSTPVRTFGTEKRKFDFTLPKLSDSKSRLSKSPSEELLSPTEVKKGIKNISFSNASYKDSYALLSSAKNANTNASLPIKVGFTEKGKNILKSAIKRPVSVSPKITRKTSVQSPAPSTSSEHSKVKSSTESLNSMKPSKKTGKMSPSSKPKSKTEEKKTQKSKKDQINDNLKQKTKMAVDKKCLSKATGAGIAKKIDNQEELDKSRSPIGSNHFFRSLFLRNLKPSASFSVPKNNWLTEKTNQLNRRRSSCSEPSIGAMKIYLKHTKPVSDSKFISLDIIRSRSASPKSVTFSDNVRTEEPVGASKRSKSLPSKLVFSQTSRPVSPVITRRQRSPILKHQSKESLVTIRRSPSPQTKLYFSETSRPVSPDVRRKIPPSPPVSPVLPRSPSCRKIMQMKQQQTQEHSRPQELTLYTCPELKLSTTSLDSFREQKFQLKPRKKCEDSIIDYDRWKEVRMRERAEHELKHLYHHLKSHEKEKGFLFLPKDVEKYRWKKEFDRGLRIKEKSVENIKEEFERLDHEESNRENAKRREIAYSKDTYKPLWRGNSVASLASTLTERRSQSEGRVKTARQKLLDNERILNHKIGSRIWSSLSMEQVNNLKKQLQEIYGDEPMNGSKTENEREAKEYVVEVPNYAERRKHIPQLSVRRNSEGAKIDLMSEDEKKLISQTLSKEVLEKVAKRRKEDKLALPLVIGKEVLGAKATEEANIKPKKEEPQKALVKTNAVSPPKTTSASEAESASTDESTRTVINLKDVQKKVEYFEKAKALETYVPTIYKPAEDGSSNSEGAASPTESEKPDDKKEKAERRTVVQSKSCQNFKEYFGESALVKFATLPLSATRKPDHAYMKKPLLRALDISPIRTISEANSIDSLNRSRSNSPYFEEAQALAKKGEVKKLKRQFEFFEDFFGEKKLKRSRSENDLKMYGHVEDLRRKYEYPVHSGRGRSRTKRGGVVSPVWLRPEDRYMPHINIISKIASLYSFSKNKTAKEVSKSMEELAEILGCPVGEVEKMKEKFDKLREEEEQISLMGHMYTSSPNLKELRDITPYLTANWIAHKYPRSEDNTRSLSSPDTSIASRDTSLVRRDRFRANSSSPTKRGQQPAILKQVGEKKDRFESSSRYTKEPDLPPPPPPPKSQGGVRSQEQESPRKYVENEVTIHYKTPVRTEIKEYVSEDELAHRQAEAMKKIYEEERKRKYFQVSKSLQELQDMKSRRHTDNFIPSQKSPISLNRYDDFDDLATPTKTRPRSPEPRLVARALYNFVGQTARELTFRKGDLIYVRRQVDKNWYEGELNAMVGLFPVNYIEIVPYEGPKTTPRKAHEGQARAKYNFVAQTHLELSLAKGELVTITRRVDENWFEGKIGGRKGIFPVAYVEVLIDPSDPPSPSTKPVAAPAAHSLLLNGSAQGKDSMGSHLYTPNMPKPIASRDTGYHHAKPVQLTGSGTYSTLPKASSSPIDQTLHIETHADPVPYRALYRYAPQNDDELELLEGDTVYVLEKCDDGWYVGSSERTGAFGTFPGNYVEKI